MINPSYLLIATIGTEIFSLIICLVLLLGTGITINGKVKRTRLFKSLILCTMAGCFCDAVSWILDGHPERTDVLYLTTFVSMIMTMLMMGVYISYLCEYIREKKEISRLPAIIGWVAAIAGVVVVTVTSLDGSMFTMQNGCFVEEKFYAGYVIANTGYMVLGLIVVTVYRKSLDLFDKIGAYAYMLIPMVTAIVSLFIENCEFAYPSLTVSLLILYILIQTDRVKNLEKEGTIVSYQASHDELTGLYNRSAFRDRIRALELRDENCGIVFGDVNGLKYINDTKGHEAGDQLLNRFAEILSGTYRLNEIFRVSGDEFVCILENVSEESFRSRVLELENILKQEDPPIACIGTAYGSCKDVESMIRTAEREMYVEKKLIHERFPEIRR